ncbi:MAG: efflux RND transporter periplasmic adaptor subunit, partial [Phycisphaerae bacterium]
MHKQSMIVPVVCLVAGLGGGRAATYFWLKAAPDANPPARRDDHAEEGEDKHVHGEHDDEDGHDEPGEAVRFTKEVMDEYGVKVATAGPGDVELDLVLPGEVVVNPDEMVHIVPRVAGIARRVTKSVGDRVEAGELLAVLESADLAQAKARYLASVQRLTLAQANVASNEELKAKG